MLAKIKDENTTLPPHRHFKYGFSTTRDISHSLTLSPSHLSHFSPSYPSLQFFHLPCVVYLKTARPRTAQAAQVSATADGLPEVVGQ